jgi:hypothetical protein
MCESILFLVSVYLTSPAIHCNIRVTTVHFLSHVSITSEMYPTFPLVAVGNMEPRRK